MALGYGNSRLRRIYFGLPTVLREAAAAAYSLHQRPRRYGQVFATQLTELQQSARASTEEIHRDQTCRLQRLIYYVAEDVPYYRQVFASQGLQPDSLKSIGDLKRFPILDKETVHSSHSLLIATSYRGPTISTHTSGTTGKGLHLLLSWDAYQRSYACAWFHYGWQGIRRGARVATLAGHPVADSSNLQPPFWVYDRIENELLFSSQHITPATLSYYANALARFQPELIRGYPSSVYLLALYLLDAGYPSIRPKAVYTSSETLFDFQRQVIEAAFGCRAFSYYSNTERAAHILQCSVGNYHIVAQMCCVEVLREDGSLASPGEEGELICTSLIDRAMPLIRYRIGDSGVVGIPPCSCGMNGPILSSITGRVEDVIVTPDGRQVGRLDHAFKDLLNVREAQIVQEIPEAIVVKVVVRSGYSAADEHLLLEELRLRLGPHIRIDIQVVNILPRTAGGKLKFVVSSVPLPIRHYAQAL